MMDDGAKCTLIFHAGFSRLVIVTCAQTLKLFMHAALNQLHVSERAHRGKLLFCWLQASRAVRGGVEAAVCNPRLVLRNPSTHLLAGRPLLKVGPQAGVNELLQIRVELVGGVVPSHLRSAARAQP